MVHDQAGATHRASADEQRRTAWRRSNWAPPTWRSRASAWARGSSAASGARSTTARRSRRSRARGSWASSFFDTAQAYGFGASEQLLAQALEGVPREQVVLATKGGLRKEGERAVARLQPAWLRAGLEASLRYLRTDYVDLYQVHWPDPRTPFEETAAALEQFVQEGKVRYVGASNFDTLQIAEFAVTRRLDTLQPPYHMLRREIEDAHAPVLPRARHRRTRVRPARARPAERQLHARLADRARTTGALAATSSAARASSATSRSSSA